MITKENIRTLLQIVKVKLENVWARICNNPAIVRTTLAGLVSAGLLTISDADLNTVNTLTLIAVSVLGGVAIRPSVKPLKKKPIKKVTKVKKKK